MDQPVAPAPTLRPLGIGDIIDRTISLYRGAPRLFFLVALLPNLVVTIVAIALNLAFPRITTFTQFDIDPAKLADPNANPFAGLGPTDFVTLAIYGLVVGLVSLVVLSVQSAALVDAAAKRYLGRSTTPGASLGVGWRASGRLVLASILAFLGVLVVVAVGTLIIVLAAAVTRSPIPVVGGVLALVVGTFYVSTSWITLPAVVTLEGLGPLTALVRSWRLAKGARWRVLGLLVLMGIISSVLGLLFTFLLLGTIATQGATRTILQQLVNLAVNVLWAPVQWGVFTLLYYDLRVRKEAFDLQLAAEALPRAT